MSDEKKTCLRDTIIPKSDQLNYDDFLTGPRVVKVTGLAVGSAEQPVHVRTIDEATGEQLRPYKPCKGMRRVLIECWGDEGKLWLGKRMTLIGNPAVIYGGARVGGIQIKALSGIPETRKVMLTVARGKRVEYTVEAMKD